MRTEPVKRESMATDANQTKKKLSPIASDESPACALYLLS